MDERRHALLPNLFPTVVVSITRRFAYILLLHSAIGAFRLACHISKIRNPAKEGERMCDC